MQEDKTAKLISGYCFDDTKRTPSHLWAADVVPTQVDAIDFPIF